MNSFEKNNLLIKEILPNQLNGMSNGNINEWDKVERGKYLMKKILSKYEI